jgi:hypothetical protein
MLAMADDCWGILALENVNSLTASIELKTIVVIIVRICRSKAVAQGDHLRPEIELSGGSRCNEKFDAQSLLWPSLYCISDSTGSSPWDTTCSISSSSKLSEVAPQHEEKDGK